MTHLTKTVALGLLTAVISPPVQAQRPTEPKITVQYQRTEIRPVLRGLFKQWDASYSVSPEVQGLVTVNLKGVTPKEALRLVLGQVGASYSVDDGVYLINRIQIPISSQKANIEIGKGQLVKSLTCRNTDIREVLDKLFKAVKVRYVIAPEVQGKVTVDLANQSLGEALKTIAGQVEASYRIKNGTYRVGKASQIQRLSDPSDPIEFDHTDIRTAISDLLQDTSISFTIDPDVEGTVTATLNPGTLWEALDLVAHSASCTYRIVAGVYEFVPRQIAEGCFAPGSSVSKP